MQIPSDLQAYFAHPTLLVVADHLGGKTYLAESDEINEVEEVTAPRDAAQDSSERVSSSVDAERLKHFVRELADIVNPSVDAYHLGNVHLVMPADVLHMLKAELKPAVLNIIRSETVGIHTKDDVLSIIKKLPKA